NLFILLGDYENRISSRQDSICCRNDVVPILSNYRDLQPAERPGHQFVESFPGLAFSDRNFAHLEPLRLSRKLRLHYPGHEVDAQDRTNDPEGVSNRIPDRRLLALHNIERSLKRSSACHGAGIDTEQVSDLDTENVSKSECNCQAGQACDKSQQIVLLPNADHAFEELPAVEDADPIQEHDQSRQ